MIPGTWRIYRKLETLGGEWDFLSRHRVHEKYGAIIFYRFPGLPAAQSRYPVGMLIEIAILISISAVYFFVAQLTRIYHYVTHYVQSQFHFRNLEQQARSELRIGRTVATKRFVRMRDVPFSWFNKPAQLWGNSSILPEQ